MGNISQCCDSKNQLDNISSFSPRITRGSFQSKSKFPPMSPQTLQLLQIAKKSQFYKEHKHQSSNSQERQKDIFCIGKDQVVYEGEVFKNEADGKGCVSFPDGSYFEGTFRESQPINGVFLFKPTCYYVGDIKNFQASGKGMFENLENGYRYQGQWKKNLAHGEGQEKYNNNQEYKGSFMVGNKFGEGVYNFADGKIYKGSFYNGHSDGSGKLFLPNGDRYEGEWKLGCMHGKGTYFWKNGEKYIGQYLNGLKHGQGRYIYQDNVVYEGSWVSGFQEGEGTIKEGYDEVKCFWQRGRKVD